MTSQKLLLPSRVIPGAFGAFHRPRPCVARAASVIVRRGIKIHVLYIHLRSLNAVTSSLQL